ncbi:MAG: hypothetical protein WCO00_04960 [Rhodospirillaceae bacterium]
MTAGLNLIPRRWTKAGPEGLDRILKFANYGHIALAVLSTAAFLGSVITRSGLEVSAAFGLSILVFVVLYSVTRWMRRTLIGAPGQDGDNS